MVHLIGHSLGGVLVLSAASLRPDIVASVITLGSPFRGIRSHPMVLEMSKWSLIPGSMN
jgi:pimeloyl-ACP methyl ester carboxylesterase